jgi:hypothetical protein
MRLQYVEPDHPVADNMRKRRGGELLELDRTLLNSIPIAQVWNDLSGMQKMENCLLRWLALRYCDIMTLNIAVPDSAFADLKAVWTDTEFWS